MKQTELDLILSRFDTLQDDISSNKDDLKALDMFIREHMKNEEHTMHKVDKRLSKLEWKAHGFATLFGVVGGFVATKIKLLFGAES